MDFTDYLVYLSTWRITNLDIPPGYCPKSNSESLKDWRIPPSLQAIYGYPASHTTSEFSVKKPVCPFAVHLQDESSTISVYKFKRNVVRCGLYFPFPMLPVTVIYTVQ